MAGGRSQTESGRISPSKPCNQILLIASTSTDCVVACGLISEGQTTNRLRWQSRWRGTGGSRTIAENHTGALS